MIRHNENGKLTSILGTSPQAMKRTMNSFLLLKMMTFLVIHNTTLGSL